MTDRLNAALEGRYAIERELGEGGMATVYLADDLKHDRKVAIKVLKPELAAVIGGERFVAEIKTTAGLQHPHILPLFDSGEADGFLYYVMPYVEGETLRERLDREKQLGVDEALSITEDVADALDYAHRQGVIHRDIKPANILLHDGRPVVADFGIAVAISAAGGGRMTETGLSLGTPHYMSPEQATADRDLTVRSDVYSLACVLYEMLAGDPPHTGPTAQSVLVRILTERPRPVSDTRASVPPHVVSVLAKALEKLPADRFESASEFREALERTDFAYVPVRRSATTASGASGAVAGAAGAGETAGDAPSAPPSAWMRDRRSQLAVGAAVLFGGLALVAVLRPPPPSAPPRPDTRAILSLDGVEIAGSPIEDIVISRDGTRLAVATQGFGRDGGPIYWRNAHDETFRPLQGSEGGGWPSFSPDGAWLVYSGERELYRIALSGGAPEPLVRLESERPLFPYWSDDGVILFSVAGTLYAVAEEGGDPSVLLESSFSFIYNARLLPGGRAVTFTDADGSTRLFVVESDSARLLVPGRVDARYVETGHLLTVDASGGLWKQPFDLERLELAGDATPVFGGMSVLGPWARYDVSENGTLVYGAGAISGGRQRPDQRLLIVSLDGQVEEVQLPPRRWDGARWSPDGESVVYASASDRGERELDLFTYNVVLGTEPRPLTFEGTNFDPVWSPDGTRIAFSSRRGGSDVVDLFVKSVLDDAPPERLDSLPGAQYPTQWPQEDRLVFFSWDGGDGDLWTFDLEGDSGVAYYNSAETEYSTEMVVSPDGTLAAYRSNPTGSGAIYVRSFPVPRQPERISAGVGAAPRWSPEGDVLYYWAQTPQIDTLWAATLERGPPFAVTDRTVVTTGDYDAFDWDLHPDGDRFLVPQAVDAATEEEGGAEAERFLLYLNFFQVLRDGADDD